MTTEFVSQTTGLLTTAVDTVVEITDWSVALDWNVSQAEIEMISDPNL
ncbi:MAG: hypothetical protein QF677_05535 [Arenicellales bacterium]|nr:hypothetical protein [Arenicellales bacterium]